MQRSTIVLLCIYARSVFRILHSACKPRTSPPIDAQIARGFWFRSLSVLIYWAVPRFRYWQYAYAVRLAPSVHTRLGLQSVSVCVATFSGACSSPCPYAPDPHSSHASGLTAEASAPPTSMAREALSSDQ